MRRSESLTKMLLAAGAISGGGAFVVGHWAVAGTPPATLGALRYVFAVGLFGLLLATSREVKRLPRGTDALRVLGMGLAVVAGYNLLFLEGLRLAPAADGGLIVPGSAPTFSILLGWALLRERPSNHALMGSAMACAGILVIFAAAGGLGAAPLGRRLGDLLYLVGGSMWGVFNVLARGLRGRIHPLPANAYAAGIGLAVLLPVALLTDGPAILASVTPATVLEAAYLAVFATVLLLWANVRGVERLGVARAAPFAYLAPLAAVLGGVLLLGERIAGLELLGGSIALAGTWIATSSNALRWPRPRRQPIVREASR